MNKRVMVLGAVQGEVSLVESFQDSGYEVVVAGLGGDYPCCEIADRFYDVDIMNRDAILRVAKEEEVCAVSSNVLSRSVVNLAWLADELHLPGIGFEVARRFDNKFLMRTWAEKAGISVPPFALAKSVDEAILFAKQQGYPLIMKPVDSGGSIGVYKVDCDEDILEHFSESLAGTQADEGVIIEGFVRGREYIVDAFTHDYICENTDVAFKEHFSIKGKFMSKSFVVQDAPHCTTRLEKKLLEANKKLVEAFELPFGPTHGEYIYCPDDDEVYLVEIAARGGGVYLSSDVIPAAAGVSINYLLSQYALGQDPIGRYGLAMEKGAAGAYSFSLPAGVIKTIQGVDECLRIPGVFGLDQRLLRVGNHVGEMIDDRGKLGPFLVKGETRQECDDIMRQVKKLFSVEVETSDGVIKGVIW